uniref:hypothetical protein n=1 Tax=Pannonibacter phragmitetus TaxID=121719 RepID=UPI00067DC5E7|nr:hypothetical protein [Pannonibacter phragmitetus]
MELTMPRSMVQAIRLLTAVLALASLVTGLGAGLARLGLFDLALSVSDRHSVFMLCGFFGTLIALERAVAQGSAAALAVPAVSGFGAVLIWFEPQSAALAFVAAGAGLAVLSAQAALALRTLFSAVLLVAAVLWPIGTGVWLITGDPALAAYIWLGFLILTITAERIELSRLRRRGPLQAGLLVLLVAVFCLGLLTGEPFAGTPWLTGTALAGLALWLTVNDVALITIRGEGLARYSAAALLCGYGWLLVAAAALLMLPLGTSAAGHDIALHAIGLGFVLSMVFAHAPIILPAVAGLRIRYSAALYLPLALLQGATALRVAGNLLEQDSLRNASGWLTMGALGLYAAALILSSRHRPRKACAAHNNRHPV